MTTSNEPVIQTRGLTKRFGHKLALDSLDIEVPAGVIFGFLGPNGAGKTTTIRLLLGFLRANAGEASVLGMEARRDAVKIRRRVGYLPGDFNLYENMTAKQYLRYLSSLRERDHMEEATRLAQRLMLSLDDADRTLSRGNKQKVGLIQALMGKPDLLLLDEPTSGLDPMMQREVQSIFREARSEGRTIFLSSHILPEVERVCDRVAIIGEGKLLLVDDVDKLRQRAPRTIEVTFHDPTPAKALVGVENVLSVEAIDERHLHCLVRGDMEPFLAMIARLRPTDLVSREPNLEEFFLDAYRKEG